MERAPQRLPLENFGIESLKIVRFALAHELEVITQSFTEQIYEVDALIDNLQDD